MESTKSANMTTTQLNNVLPKTLGPFKGISATPDSVRANQTRIHSNASLDRVTLSPHNAQSNGRTNRDNDRKKANYPSDEDGTVDGDS